MAISIDELRDGLASLFASMKGGNGESPLSADSRSRIGPVRELQTPAESTDTATGKAARSGAASEARAKSYRTIKSAKRGDVQGVAPSLAPMDTINPITLAVERNPQMPHVPVPAQGPLYQDSRLPRETDVSGANYWRAETENRRRLAESPLFGATSLPSLVEPAVKAVAAPISHGVHNIYEGVQMMPEVLRAAQLNPGPEAFANMAMLANPVTLRRNAHGAAKLGSGAVQFGSTLIPRMAGALALSPYAEDAGRKGADLLGGGQTAQDVAGWTGGMAPFFFAGGAPVAAGVTASELAGVGGHYALGQIPGITPQELGDYTQLLKALAFVFAHNAAEGKGAHAKHGARLGREVGIERAIMGEAPRELVRTTEALGHGAHEDDDDKLDLRRGR